MAAWVNDVLARLRLAEPPTRDLAGLSALYAAWCGAIPFDNVQKLLHLHARRGGPLPGSTAESFFADWLAHRTGGTCWAGNGALFTLVSELGFAAERATATMMAASELPGPNHGTVVVSIDAERYVVDASMLTRVPMRLPRPAEAFRGSEAHLPRVEWEGDTVSILWWVSAKPEGLACRLGDVGCSAERWDALHQASGVWSPFNYALYVRAQAGARTFGVAHGQRFEWGGGLSTLRPIDRDRFLVEELGLDRSLVSALPEDAPVPPRPAPGRRS